MDVSLTRSGRKEAVVKIIQVVARSKFMQNKILALKYRPQEFKDLIGQEVIAKTITNAIEITKLNAYLLTGIRGVETTTARLIANKLFKKIENKSDCNLKKVL